ncbi:MAG: DUF177 domain-containing protein [Bacillota bacterium]|nr:DUF177 domain-containing protein [Bacillota bacterium]
MLIDISGVLKNENSGLDIEFDMDGSDIELYGDEHPFKTPLHVSGKVENKAGIVTLLLNISGMMEMLCARCLKPVSHKVDVDVENLLVTELQNADDDKLLLVTEDLFDVGKIAADAVVVNAPVRLLCREDCKGLCPKCGKDLNEGGCDCKNDEVDSRLAVLQKLLNKEK